MQETRATYVFVLAVSLPLTIACGNQSGELLAVSPSQSSGIIDGTPSKTGEFTSAGAILVGAHDDELSLEPSRYSMLCTGTLIAPDVILTAGHCQRTPGTHYYFTLALDVTSLQASPEMPPEPLYEVAAWVRHPDFGTPPGPGLGLVNDVSLAFLTEPLYDVEPATVLTPDLAEEFLKVGTPVSIVGYGMRTDPVRHPGVRDAGIKAQAESVISEVSEWEMKIGDNYPVAQKCYGDSGGPSYMKTDMGTVIVGVTSRSYRGTGCSRGGIDERVDALYDWIAGTMQEACDDGTRAAPCSTLSLHH